MDAANFVSGAALSWQAALKQSGVCLELITDINMYEMINDGIRGGYSGAALAYAVANHPLMKSRPYDPAQEQVWLMMFDIVNQYGYCMLGHLPVSNFSFLEDPSVMTEEVIRAIPATSDEGYLLEVSLDYPESLHEAHNCFPLAPEHYRTRLEDLSEEQRQTYTKIYKKETYKGSSKLVTTLWDKEKYVVHYRALQLYLRLGLRLKAVHRVIKFHQAPFLRDYIQHLTDLRTRSKDPFEKAIWKLMINVIYGKISFFSSPSSLFLIRQNGGGPTELQGLSRGDPGISLG